MYDTVCDVFRWINLGLLLTVLVMLLTCQWKEGSPWNSGGYRDVHRLFTIVTLFLFLSTAEKIWIDAKPALAVFAWCGVLVYAIKVINKQREVSPS